MTVKKATRVRVQPAGPRGTMDAAERRLRSALAQLARGRGLLCGTIVERFRTCGHLSCKCARGQRHRAMCLFLRREGKLRQLYVPPAYEERVRQWVANYQELKKLVDQISAIHWQNVRQRG